MSTSSSSRGRRGLPRGPHGLTPSEVAQSQRNRLITAMTEAVAERGYTATPVADVIERAEVSRKTFYVHFRDRHDCLIAAYQVGAKRTLRLLSVATDRNESGRNRLPAAISALCDAAVAEPAACHLQVVQIAAAGQGALLEREHLILALGKILRDSLPSASSAPPMPLMGMIAGGLLRVIELRARTGLQDQKTLVSELTRWTRSYLPAPAVIAGAGQGRHLGESVPLGSAMQIGGRAPGTLSLTPKRLAEAGRGVSSSFTAHNQRERILDAVASLCASKGYVALTVDEIVAQASVSLNTFYEHFKDKEDAFVVAHELGHLRGTAILQSAISQARSWDGCVREGITALLGFFFSEPAFARLAAIEAPIASPQIGARARAHLAAYADMLLDGAPRTRKPPAVAREAIAASLHTAVFAYAVYGVIRDPVRAHNYASYLVLAPFLGPQKALVSQ